MLIDWFTVGAQFVNFLILVWLLKRFLYKPILDAIDAREKRIAAGLTDADAKQAEAKKQLDELGKKNKTFDDERAGLLGKAAEEAKAARAKLLEQAQKDADGLRAAQAAALRSDQEKLGNEITRLTKDEVFEITRKTLSDLTTASLEERLAEVFTRRLSELSGKAKLTLGAALKTSPEPAVLTSTFDLPANQRAAIQNALNETFSAEVRVRFKTSPNDVCGIELTASGQKISWGIDEYLAALDQKLGSLLEEKAPAVDSPAPQAENEPVLVAGGK
jgi:F-type H+-transporting ATPase subunit b